MFAVTHMSFRRNARASVFHFILECGSRSTLAVALCLCATLPLFAQSGGNSTSVIGTVLDPTGAVVPNATVEIHNPVSQFDRSATSDGSGKFTIPNVPFNNYHLTT